MTTLAAAVESTRRLLYGSSRPARNQLNADITAAATSLVYTHTAPTIPPIGSLIAIGQELLYVWDKNEATATLTVSRGEGGTTAAVHTAADEIEVNARFPRPTIAAAILDEIRSWEPDLFRVDDVAFPATTLPALLDIGDEYADTYGWISAQMLRDATWIPADVSVVRGLPASSFPSTVGVQFVPGSTQTISRITSSSTVEGLRVTLALPFDLDVASLTTDLVDGVGLAPSMVDLAVWGAAIRLLSSAEVSRTDPTAQGQSRDATQVRVGDQTQVAMALTRRYDRRFEQEVNKMLRRNVVRF